MGDAVGDDTESWGVDGMLKRLRHCDDNDDDADDDDDDEWGCSWTQGDTIGLAANMELGKIAISKNGDWMEAPCGVVFHDEKIKAGVFPCFTCKTCKAPQ